MIYLKYLASRARVDVTRPVTVVTAGPPWLERQVEAEMADLFPAAPRRLPADAELIVVAAMSSELAALADRTAPRCRPQAVLWLYAIDTGRVTPITARALSRWSKRQTAINRASSWGRAHPARWRKAGQAAEFLA
jgi:hypothetical protein